LGAEPLLASECRIYVYNLALRLGVPVKGGGLKEGIEVFPRQEKLEHGEYGNAIRAPLGVHRKTNRRYWFYEAEPTPEAQLGYLDRLTKLTEAELRTFIEGMSLPEAYRPVAATPYTPPASSPRYGWPLDEGRVELNQGFRPKESAIQPRSNELFNLGVTYLQEPFYICAIVPDEVFTVLEDVHNMSFAGFHIVWHSPHGSKGLLVDQSFSWQRIY